MVPHLVTALKGPINEIEQRILDATPAVERWFRLQWMERSPPVYSSVDIRNAGFKLAPVDTNLFPGGWNNLTPEMLPWVTQATQPALGRIVPKTNNLLIIPENHTRNPFYLTNVAQLHRIFQQAGFNVRIGSINPEITQAINISLPNGEQIALEPVIRVQQRLGLKDFDPCTILLNNDLSAGAPGILEDLRGQNLLPPLHAGWWKRRKSVHFKYYEEVSKRFAELMGMDPWLLNPLFNQCSEIDFFSGRGLDSLRNNVDALLGKIRRKYKEYGILDRPFVVVKADNGTYGMGIMMVHDLKDLDVLNRKTRNKMSVIKDGQEVNSVIIQEGVPTIERVDEAMAEPVVYMMDRHVVGGFYRVHGDRGPDENLNAPGASFVAMSMGERILGASGVSTANRFYIYAVIAQLAALAASHEIEAADVSDSAMCLT